MGGGSSLHTIMRITRRVEKINLNHRVDVPVDVHNNILYYFFEIDGYEYTDIKGLRVWKGYGACRCQNHRDLYSCNASGSSDDRKSLGFVSDG